MISASSGWLVPKERKTTLVIRTRFIHMFKDTKAKAYASKLNRETTLTSEHLDSTASQHFAFFVLGLLRDRRACVGFFVVVFVKREKSGEETRKKEIVWAICYETNSLQSIDRRTGQKFLSFAFVLIIFNIITSS